MPILPVVCCTCIKVIEEALVDSRRLFQSSIAAIEKISIQQVIRREKCGSSNTYGFSSKITSNSQHVPSHEDAPV